MGRFINADSLISGTGESVQGYNLFAYCDNNAVNNCDPTGHWKMPNWAKVAVGAVALTAAVALTVVTGGTAAPILIGMAISVVSSAAIGGAIGYATGGFEGMKQGIIDGACDGFMWGGLGAAAGAVVAVGVKAVKTAQQGVTIGRNMEQGFQNVKNAAGLSDTAIYSKEAIWKPLNENYYKFISTNFGSQTADNVSLFCNKVFIKTMKSMGAVIYDSGLNGTTAVGRFYGMEKEVLNGYKNLIKIF